MLARMARRGSTRLLIGGLLVAVMALVLVPALVRAGTAQRGAATAPRLGYVGRVPGTRAFVGVVVRGVLVTAYVCDGRTLARWFKGSAHDGRALLTSASGGRLELRLSGVARGVLRIPGRKAASFVAVAAHGRAGLFRSDRAVTKSGRRSRVLTGWVRLNDGSLRGASVTSRFRILHPTPTIEAVLLADPGGQIGPPAGVPALALRQTSKLVPVCELIKGVTRDGKTVPLTTRHCGLPLPGLKLPAANGPSVRLRPRGFRLSAGALATFAGGLDGFITKQRAALFKRAGQREPIFFSAAERTKINSQAAAMLKDPKVLDAADQLRRAPQDNLLDRMESYRRAAQGYTDTFNGFQGQDISPLVGLFTLGVLRPLGLPVEETYTGPWAETSYLAFEGDDWETADGSDTICHDFLDCIPLFGVLADATNLEAQARAGFNSTVTYDRANQLTFDVPPNAGEVEVEITGTQGIADVETQKCFGVAGGMATWYYGIFRVRDDGSVDPNSVAGDFPQAVFDLDDTVVDGGTDDCTPQFAPPVPDPPEYDALGGDSEVFTFTPPPEGGTYVFEVATQVYATVLMGGTSVSQAVVGIDKVIVRHH